MKKATILITGVSRGIGYQLAKRFLQDHHRVIGIGRVCPPDLGPNFSFIGCDLGVEENRQKTLHSLAELEIDCFIHSASPSIEHKPHPMVTTAELQESFQVAVQSGLEIISLIGKKMRERNYGRIIFLGSAVQITGSSGQTHYHVAKSAQEGLVKSLCSELADHGITVNQLLLGPVDTEGLKEKTTEAQREKILASIPGKEFVNVEQIYAFLKYVNSYESAPLNGAMIPFVYGAQWRALR